MFGQLELIIEILLHLLGLTQLKCSWFTAPFSFAINFEKSRY